MWPGHPHGLLVLFPCIQQGPEEVCGPGLALGAQSTQLPSLGRGEAGDGPVTRKQHVCVSLAPLGCGNTQAPSSGASFNHRQVLVCGVSWDELQWCGRHWAVSSLEG